MNRLTSTALLAFAIATGFLGYQHGKAPKSDLPVRPQASDVLREVTAATIDGSPAVKASAALLKDKNTVTAIRAIRRYLKISEHEADVTQLEERANAIGGADPRAFRAAAISAHRVLTMLTAHPTFVKTHPNYKAFMFAHESNIMRITTLETTLAAYFKEAPIQRIRCGTGMRSLKIEDCGY